MSIAVNNERMAQTLGDYVRRARQASGLTLRKVEELSEGRIGNAYLSQIEGGRIKEPSTKTLSELATIYGLPYAEVLTMAGLPTSADMSSPARIAGVPDRAMSDLSKDEVDQVMRFVAFLKSQRS